MVQPAVNVYILLCKSVNLRVCFFYSLDSIGPYNSHPLFPFIVQRQLTFIFEKQLHTFSRSFDIMFLEYTLPSRTMVRKVIKATISMHNQL